MGFSAYYALEEKTGKQVWRFDTQGEAMPGALYADGVLYIATGDGHMYALMARTGQLKWKTDLGGFVSMSSINRFGDLLYVGCSNPNFIYAINRHTGDIVWKQTIAGIANTGMGDNSPVVDEKRKLVIQDAIVDANPEQKTSGFAIFAMDAATGAIKWQTNVGRGPTPPAYKAGVAMVHDAGYFSVAR